MEEFYEETQNSVHALIREHYCEYTGNKPNAQGSLNVEMIGIIDTHQ